MHLGVTNASNIHHWKLFNEGHEFGPFKLHGLCSQRDFLCYTIIIIMLEILFTYLISAETAKNLN